LPDLWRRNFYNH